MSVPTIAPGAGAEPPIHVRPSVATRPRSRLSLTAGAFGLFLVCFFVLELTCRIEEWVQYRVPLNSRATSLDALLVRDADGLHGRPGAQFQRWRMNSLGMRGPDVPVAKAPGTLRIVTVGASETFGLYESAGKDYPAQMADSLGSAIGAGRCGATRPAKVEVLNTSFPGMSLPTIDNDLRTRVRRLRPNFVVIYPAPVSYLEEELPRPPGPSRDVSPPVPWHRALYPRVVGRVRTQVKEVLPEALKTPIRRWQAERSVRARPAGWQYTDLPADRLERFGADLSRVVATVREIGATPLVVTHANSFVGRPRTDDDALQAWQKFYPRAPGRMIIAFDSAAREVALRVSASAGAPALDATRVLAAMPPSAFADFVHFTDLGASAMGGALAVAICDTGSSGGTTTAR